MISLAINLIKSVFIRGTARHLDQPWDRVFRPPPADSLWQGLGVRHPVLADWYQPLPTTDDDEQLLIVQSRHLALQDAPPQQQPEPGQPPADQPPAGAAPPPA